ncbi:MAG TPA: hydrolase Nlp/P60 [Microscillaceae bacterium]|nr:hydrolase Nlp/P60 [Microscillaceae bacterium]
MAVSAQFPIIPEQWGQVFLGVIPLRAEPSDKSELVSQLVFGEQYQVLALEPSWVKIKAQYDGYEGWVAINQVQKTTHNSVSTVPKIVSSPWGKLEKGAQKFWIPLGSELYGLTDQNQLLFQDTWWHYEGDFIPNNTSTSPISPESLLATMRLFWKTPYLWGGKTPWGVDCSGFVQQVMKLWGVKLYRDAYQQAAQGSLVTSFTEAQTGDVAFFHRDNRIVHVGIVVQTQHLHSDYQQDKKADYHIFHAFEAVRCDILDGKGIFNTSLQVYTHQLAHIQ